MGALIMVIESPKIINSPIPRVLPTVSPCHIEYASGRVFDTSPNPKYNGYLTLPLTLGIMFYLFLPEIMKTPPHLPPLTSSLISAMKVRIEFREVHKVE